MARRSGRRDPHRGDAHPRRHHRAGATRGSSGRGAVAEIIGALADAAGRGLPIVAYNAAYDLSVLEREAERYGLTPLPGPGPVIDPLVIDKAVDQYRRGKRTLTAAAAHYGVALPMRTMPAPTRSPRGGSHRPSPGRSPCSPTSRSASCTRGRSSGAGTGRELPGLPARNGEPEFTTSGPGRYDGPLPPLPATTADAPTSTAVLDVALPEPASAEMLF